LGVQAALAGLDRKDLGLPGDSQTGGDLFGEKSDAAAPPAETGKAGRPPGATNRNTRDVIAYHEALGYRSPLLTLAELGSGGDLVALLTRAKLIANQLGCKGIEAMRLIIDAADRYAPYRHSKMPLAVDVTTKSANLHLHLGDGVASGGAGVLQLFDQAAKRAAAEGFEVPALEQLAQDLGEDENPENSDG